MANKHRGEVDVELCGKTYTLRPSFSANCEFEDLSGTTIFEALQGLRNSKAPMRMIAAAIWAGIRGANPGKERECPSFSDVGEMVYKAGPGAVLTTVLQYLANAIAGEEALEENAEQDDDEEGPTKGKVDGKRRKRKS